MLRTIVMSSLVLATAGTAVAHEHGLPLGDGKISSEPRKGYAFSCQQRFDKNAPGARRAGDWIKGDTWYPSLKPSVEGEVYWPNSRITISRER